MMSMMLSKCIQMADDFRLFRPGLSNFACRPRDIIRFSVSSCSEYQYHSRKHIVGDCDVVVVGVVVRLKTL